MIRPRVGDDVLIRGADIVGRVLEVLPGRRRARGGAVMPGDSLVQAAPAILALWGIVALCLWCPRSRESLTRREEPAPISPAPPSPEQVARDLITHAARNGFAEALNVRVLRIPNDGYLVNGLRFPSASQAEAYVRRLVTP